MLVLVCVQWKMIFVILLVVLCHILLGDCAFEKKHDLKFPRTIMDQSSVRIVGILDVRAPTRATITGRELLQEHECIVDIKPQEDLFIVNNHTEFYNFGNLTEKILFEFEITANNVTMNDTMNDSNNDIGGELHLSFIANGQGQKYFEKPCNFTSLMSVDTIQLHGFMHIREITFLYND